MFNKSLGAKYKAEGYAPKKPILIIPGLCSSCLKVVESPSEDWKGKRIWLSMSSIGLDKVWDIMPFFGKKKKKKTGGGSVVTDVEEMAKVDENIKRKWIQHMCLLDDGITDPPGIKLRAVKGLKGCKYLDPGAITDSLSYVFGPFVEMLEDAGYVDGYNLNAAPYDWRLPPYRLEERDHYFSDLQRMIEDMYRINNAKVVIIAHSLGNRVTHYFSKFMERKEGRQWISKYVDTWIAVGPLFLGAPKLLRAMVTGDRMGLEAFLFPHEGIQLGRSIGSSPWMFPYVTPDHHDFTAYSYLRNAIGMYEPKTNKDILIEGGAENVYNKYRDYYEGDPLVGLPQQVMQAPPIDNLYAIYGINLKTETGYFFKQNSSKSKKGTEFTLDNQGSISNYKCEGGIIFETKDTKQVCLGGQARGGDGTVPYPSMSYCKKWKNNLNLKVVEIEGAEHREILKNKTLWQLTLEFVCQAPPPKELPKTFADIEYKIEILSRGKRIPKSLILDSKFIRISGAGVGKEYRKGYSTVANISLDEIQGDRFVLEFGANEVTCISPQSSQIVQEIASRCRYIEDARATYTEVRNEFGQTLVHQAILTGSTSKLVEVLSDNVDINAIDLQGNTPLIMAAEKGNLDLIVVLLQSPAIDVNKQAKNSKSVIHYMCMIKIVDAKKQEKWENIMFNLKDKGALLDVPAELGETPLHIAVKRSNHLAINWLLSNSASVNATSTAGETALHYAVRMNQRDIVSILLENGADKNIDISGTGSPLDIAKANPDLHSFLLQFSSPMGGARKKIGGKGSTGGGSGKQLEMRPMTMISACGQNGRTPLHDAAFNDRIDLVFELALQYRNYDIVDDNGWTALHCAASQGNLEILMILLRSPNVSINRQTKSGSTVLHYLMRLKPSPSELNLYLQTLEKVKQKGAELNLMSAKRIVPLHEAALHSNIEGAKWLLSHNAKVNSPSENGYTALHFAVQSGCVAFVELLKSYNADVNMKGKEGTALDVAIASGNQQIISILRSSSASASFTPPRKVMPKVPQSRPAPPSPPQQDDDDDDLLFVDDDEIIFSKNSKYEDDDDDAEVLPLAMKRKQSIRENRTYSTIFTKPIIAPSNAFSRPNQRPHNNYNNYNNHNSPNHYNNNTNNQRGSPRGGGGSMRGAYNNNPNNNNSYNSYNNNNVAPRSPSNNYLSKSAPISMSSSPPSKPRSGLSPKAFTPSSSPTPPEAPPLPMSRVNQNRGGLGPLRTMPHANNNNTHGSSSSHRSNSNPTINRSSPTSNLAPNRGSLPLFTRGTPPRSMNATPPSSPTVSTPLSTSQPISSGRNIPTISTRGNFRTANTPPRNQ